MAMLKAPLLLSLNPSGAADCGTCVADDGVSRVMSGTGMHSIKEAEDWSSRESSAPLQGPLLGLVKAAERGKDLMSPPPAGCSAAASFACSTIVRDRDAGNAEAVCQNPGNGCPLPQQAAATSTSWSMNIASIHGVVKSSNDAASPFIAQSKEWCALDNSLLSADSEVLQMADRRQLHTREVKDLQAPSVDWPARSLRSGIDANVLRCGSWCFFFVEMWLSLACITLFLLRKHWVAMTFLVPPHILFLSLEVHLMRHDRAFLQWSQTALHSLGALQAALLEVAVVMVFGCLNCFAILRARRCWRERGLRQLPVVDEIEAQCIRGGGDSLEGARFDSHLLFVTGVPRTVVLTNILTGQDSYSPTEIIVMCALALLSLISVVQAVMNFDYYASRWVRKQYELEQRFRFHAVHYAFRLSEVTGRILVLVAVTKAFRFSIPSVTTVLGLDYLLGVLVLLWVTGFAPGSPQMILVLSVPLYVVDVCRYIDEHGVTRQAKKVSKLLYWVRNLQLLVMVLLYWDVERHADQSRFWGILVGHGARVLPVLAAATCGACLVLRKFTRMGHTGVDLFVASKYGHADLVVEILSSGCDVNMVQMDDTRETPLHAAAWRGQAPCVSLLLEHGADPTLLDARGENPLHRACRRGDAATIQALLSPPAGSASSLRENYKQSVFQVNKTGHTPLQVLRKNSPWMLAQLLVEAQQSAAGAGGCEDYHPGDGASQSRVQSRSISMDAARIYGQIVKDSRARFLFGPGRATSSPRTAGLASFMFSTGIGEQIAEYLDSDQGQGHKIHLSSLRTQGVLGSGAFGRVFKVLDVETGEIYALKLQRRERTTKFAVREAQALHQSSHAYIVRLVEIFQTQNFYGLIMELCDRSLNAFILESVGVAGRAEGLQEAKAARYAACITLALEYLHGLEIIFRDLKPDNVLMTLKDRGDFAKLTDFGLARSIKPPQVDSPKVRSLEEEDKTPSEPSPLYASAVCGTPRFMAPEIFDQSTPEDEDAPQRLRRLTSRDWYALGCCLFLMLLGEDGGIKINIQGRDVLVPPAPGELPVALRRAAKAFRIDEEAFQLVASLTAPVVDRAGAEFVRGSLFMREAVLEMEAEARRYVPEGCELYRPSS